MSSPTHGEATDGQTEKLTAAMGQACRTPTTLPGHRDGGPPKCQEEHPAASFPQNTFQKVLYSKFTQRSSTLHHKLQRQGIPSQATKALMQHPSGSLEHLQAGGSSSLSLHPLGNLALGTTSQASSPVE